MLADILFIPIRFSRKYKYLKSPIFSNSKYKIACFESLFKLKVDYKIVILSVVLYKLNIDIYLIARLWAIKDTDE